MPPPPNAPSVLANPAEQGAAVAEPSFQIQEASAGAPATVEPPPTILATQATAASEATDTNQQIQESNSTMVPSSQHGTANAELGASSSVHKSDDGAASAPQEF